VVFLGTSGLDPGALLAQIRHEAEGY
jgi:hypothetical protein